MPRHYFYTSLRLNLGREDIKEAHVKDKGADDLPGLDVCVTAVVLSAGAGVSERSLLINKTYLDDSL